MPSRFIDELPADHVDVLTPPGLYGGGYGAAMAFAGANPGDAIYERAARADVYNSPGWKRMQARAAGRKAAAPRASVTIDATSFGVGDRVIHAKFGEGRIMGIAEDTLTVQFDTGGFKTIKAGYVQPAGGGDDVPF